MNVKLIRAIDKWMGIPACLGATVLYKALGPFLKPKVSPPAIRPQHILFLELSEMGSAVIAYPAMRYVEAQYPGASLYFLTFHQNRFSVEVLGAIPPDRVLTIDLRSPFRFLFTTYRAVKALRRIPVDTVFDLELFSRFSALLTGFSGARRRVGFGRYREEGLYRGGLMTHRVLYNSHQHMWKNFVALVKAIEREGEVPLVKEAVRDADCVLPRFMSLPEDRERLMDRLASTHPAVRSVVHLVLLNPSAGALLPIRAWPPANYEDLAERIVTTFNAMVVIIGLDEARPQATRICERVGRDRCIDLTGQTSFKDLMDLLNLAQVLVTADSGPAHFASLTDIHNVVLFGPETPALYRPLGPHVSVLCGGLSCSPCLSAYNHRDTVCRDPACMRAITVDQVFECVSKALKGTAP